MHTPPRASVSRGMQPIKCAKRSINTATRMFPLG
jgi:hypothetical protein